MVHIIYRESNSFFNNKTNNIINTTNANNNYIMISICKRKITFQKLLEKDKTEHDFYLEINK